MIKEISKRSSNLFLLKTLNITNIGSLIGLNSPRRKISFENYSTYIF